MSTRRPLPDTRGSQEGLIGRWAIRITVALLGVAVLLGVAAYLS